MLGWIRFEHRRRLRLEREDLLGLPVWALRLPEQAWGLERRLAKGARRLVSQGVTRVLVPPGFAWWNILEKCGLRPVDPGALRTALVPLWTGHVLAQMGIPPEQATVALTGPRETQAMVRAARALCPLVRSLVICVPGEGELAHQLRREFGIPVLPPRSARPHVAISFDPEAQLPGTAFTLADAPLPDGCEPMPLLCALWECGKLPLGRIAVAPSPAGQPDLENFS